MINFHRLLVICIVFVLFLFFLHLSFATSNVAFAATTPFRSARIVTTDGTSPYTNLNNCSTTDGQTCDRTFAASFANLYFRDFGTYEDFGMPEGSKTTKIRIRVTGKTSSPIYVGASLEVPATSNCQFPSDLWTMWNLGGNVLRVQNFVTDVVYQGTVTQAISGFCLHSSNFENKMLTFRINYSTFPAWSANIDNFEIAFDYDPGLTPTPTPTPKTPLILIPGIGGSELKTNEMVIWSDSDGHGGTFTNVYTSGEKVWVNNFQSGLPGDDDYFDVLRMKENGQSSEANLSLTGTLFDGYQETINFFLASGYILNQDFFVFPYDWRRDISLTVPLLDQKIDSIKQQTGAEKIDIVAHSMGGLVARNYVSDNSRASKVRKLFTLGTPHLGSVKFLKAIRFGDCLLLDIGPFCLSIAPSEVKDVIQNMISGFELAPSQEYFNFYNGQDNDHLLPYQNNGQSLNYSQIKSFLTNLGYNTLLFGPSESFHILDNTLVNTNGVEITNIAGSGQPTLGQIREKSIKDFFGNTISKKDGFTINGDETVPLFSASLIDLNRGKSLLGDAEVFYTKQKHGSLVTSGPALNLIKNILNNNSQLPDGVSSQPYSFSGTQVSIYSPVNVHAYDSFGNHTGPTSDGNFEANIPGSLYDTLDDAKFIWLQDDGQYSIKFEATGKGSFDFKIRKYENNENTKTVLYKNIPLTENTKAQTIFDTLGNPPTLLVDKDNNGITDFEISSSSILLGDDISDQIPPQTTVELSEVEGLNGWYKSDVLVTLNPQDEASGSGILKTEYSLDNGLNVNIYTEPFTILSEKINKLKFRSIDSAGNEEEPKEIEIKIDKTAPVVLIDANPKILWPPNNKMVDVEITGNSSDINLLNTKITVEDEYHKIEPIVTDFGQIIKLEAKRNGNDRDGRKYMIKAIAEDLAGNTSQDIAEVIVPHDQRK